MLTRKLISPLKTIFKCAFFAAAFCCWILIWVVGIEFYKTGQLPVALQKSAVASAFEKAKTPPAPKIANGLRYTAMGWQNPSHWARKQPQAKPIALIQVHPLIFALALVFACLIAIVADSPDDEVERLIAETRSRATRPRPANQ